MTILKILQYVHGVFYKKILIHKRKKVSGRKYSRFIVFPRISLFIIILTVETILSPK